MSKWPKEIQQSICHHMNQTQSDVVLRFVKQLADQPDALAAEMVGIDADGVRVVARTLHGDEHLLVPFHPPLSSYEEAQSRLAAMAASLLR